MISDYLDKLRKRKVKKLLRLQKPFLMGRSLDQEVDKIIGISDSGKMDWAMTKKAEASPFPTKDSITEKNVREVAGEFNIRPYILYWFFIKKVTKLEASGRTKHDYLAVLKEVASNSIKKSLSDEEKIVAALFFAEFTNVSLTRKEAEIMLEEGKL